MMVLLSLKKLLSRALLNWRWIYPSAQLGDDRAAIEMLQLGTLDVSIPSTGPLANFYPEYNVFDLPLWSPFREDVADKCYAANLVTTCWKD